MDRTPEGVSYEDAARTNAEAIEAGMERARRDLARRAIMRMMRAPG
ncbi:hypothetical protein [Roseomonas populi]|uniref:Uncharacterized protein n=1 Tax=Roseomonas populi TaxID=3121582 RepID=A0ABT1XDI1_9PROT|nr:hypothetical protein [Roseomonas pecuniae]MCR0985187.1 hypothetical protein [Roseomonas pecuniae]